MLKKKIQTKLFTTQIKNPLNRKETLTVYSVNKFKQSIRRSSVKESTKEGHFCQINHKLRLGSQQ